MYKIRDGNSEVTVKGLEKLSQQCLLSIVYCYRTNLGSHMEPRQWDGPQLINKTCLF